MYRLYQTSATVVACICLITLHAEPSFAGSPTAWSITDQVEVDNIVRTYSTGTASPPYAVTAQVKAKALDGIETSAGTSLPKGMLTTVVTGYAPNASAYASYQDELQVANLNPSSPNYIVVKVEVPGSVNISNEYGNIGAGVSLMLAGCNDGGTITAQINASFYTSGTVSEAQAGTWIKTGTDPKRTFETKVISPIGGTSCLIDIYYAMSVSSSNMEVPAASASLKLQTFFALPTGATWSSASGALLSNEPSHVTFHH